MSGNAGVELDESKKVGGKANHQIQDIGDNKLEQDSPAQVKLAERVGNRAMISMMGGPGSTGFESFGGTKDADVFSSASAARAQGISPLSASAAPVQAKKNKNKKKPGEQAPLQKPLVQEEKPVKKTKQESAPTPKQEVKPPDPEAELKAGIREKTMKKFAIGTMFQTYARLGITDMGAKQVMNETGIQSYMGALKKARKPEEHEQILEQGSEGPGGNDAYLEAMTNEAGDFFSNLEPEEAATAIEYTAAQSSDYNAVGRSGRQANVDSKDKFERNAGILSRGLKKYRQNHDLTLYRAIDKDGLRAMFANDKSFADSIPTMDISELVTAMQSKVGAVIFDKGFMSTSTDKTFGWGGQVRLVIKLPKGSRGAPIMGMSAHENEHEYLLDMDQKMVITGAREENNKVQLYVTVINGESSGEAREGSEAQ